MRERAERAVRRPETRAFTTSRDLDALELLAWGGVLATRHFFPFVFPSRRVAERRLRALLDLGLVRARTQTGALHKDTLFALATAGIAALDEARSLERVRPANFPRPQKLEHCLVIRDVFVAFLVHGKRSGQVLDDIVFEADDGLPGLREAGLIPDLVVRFVGELVPPILIEVDLGHERRAVLEDKLSKYERYLTTTTTRLLFVARARRRAADVAARFALPTGESVCSVDLSALAAGVSIATRALFAPVLRTERTGRLVEVTNTTTESAEGSGAFRVVGRSVRREQG